MSMVTPIFLFHNFNKDKASFQWEKNWHKGPVIIYVEVGGREKRRGGHGYFRLARGGG